MAVPLATQIFDLPEGAGDPNLVYVDPGQPCPQGMVRRPELDLLCIVSPCPGGWACQSGEPFDLSGKPPPSEMPPATKALLGTGGVLLLLGLIYAAIQVRARGR